ncbi:hypothetical protein [Ideonella sp. YS5]|uniref:hypothetical protein n=1 Tax=Ideonella sp. YS5 TaxID=3453714 RepID=UPI003EEEAA68
MNPHTTDGSTIERHDPPLCWPRLSLAEDGRESPAATPLALEVCEALERRLERLAAHELPPQVAQDVTDMWRDLDAAQSLLAGEQRPDHAQRLLADLHFWLPVCETWIGLGSHAPARGLALMN